MRTMITVILPRNNVLWETRDKRTMLLCYDMEIFRLERIDNMWQNCCFRPVNNISKEKCLRKQLFHVKHWIGGPTNKNFKKTKMHQGWFYFVTWQ